MRWRTYSIVLFSLLMVFSAGTFAQDKPIDNPASLKKRLKDFADKNNSITCGFTQTKQVAYVKDPLITRGKFWFAEPGNIRWEQTSPDSYTMVIAGENMKVKKGEKVERHDLSSNRFLSEFRNLMVSTIDGTILDNGKFTTTYFENTGDYVLKMKPQQSRMKKMFTVLELHFNKSNLHLSKMVMVEKSGDSTSISFENAIFNAKINPTTFTKL